MSQWNVVSLPSALAKVATGRHSGPRLLRAEHTRDARHRAPAMDHQLDVGLAVYAPVHPRRPGRHCHRIYRIHPRWGSAVGRRRDDRPSHREAAGTWRPVAGSRISRRRPSARHEHRSASPRART